MKTMHNVKLIAALVMLAAGVAACDKPGPAESAGKQVDQAVSDARIEMDAAASKIGEKVDEGSNKIDMAVQDTEITTKVKASFLAEPSLSSLQISVDTVEGRVKLTGTVASKDESNKAESLASAVEGVTSVDNQLEVKP